jgi:site-specific DNA recombinase
MTKRAALYARVSYYDRQGENLDGQLQMCREYAEKCGYEVVAELTEDDRGASGAKFELPALDKALTLAEQGRVDVLVTREMDRFARGLAKQFIKEREFQTAGVDVEYALEAYDDTPEGQLTKHVRAIIAEYEREKINERMTRGRYRAARKGNVMVARAPFGRRVVIEERDGKPVRTLRPDPTETEWIRKMFRWYVYGDGDTSPLSYRAIARRLTTEGAPTPTDLGHNPTRKKIGTSAWLPQAVQKILTNRVHMGEWIYHTAEGDIVVPVEPVIDRDLFDRAQRRRAAARETSPRNTKYDYLLRGHVQCAECGYRMRATTHRPTRGNKTYTYRYYRCPRSVKRDREPRQCDTVVFSTDKTDAAVWEELKRLLTDPERLQAAFEHSQGAGAVQQLETQLAQANQNIEDSKDRLDRLLDLYLDGHHTLEVIRSRQQKIEATIARQERERDKIVAQLEDATGRLAQMQSVQEFAHQFKARLATADEIFQRRRWIVDVLDVTARLGVTDEVKMAHLEVEGIHLSALSLERVVRAKKKKAS